LIASLIHWRAAFAVGALFVTGAFAWVVLTRQALEEDTRGLRRKSTSEAAAPPSPASLADKPGSRPSHATALLSAYLATFILSFTWSGFLSTAMPLYGGEVVGVSTSTLGMVFTAGLLVDLALLLPVGWVSDRLDYRVVLAPAMLLMALVLACFPQAQGLWGLLLVSIGMHTSFAAWGMPSAALARLARGARLRQTMGVYRFLVDSAVVVAPWLIGTLIGRYGYELPSWITAAGVLLTAVVVTYGLRPARE
jgi:predicted MFS family arabinose efflux permease